jgi:hypothetical protein
MAADGGKILTFDHKWEPNADGTGVLKLTNGGERKEFLIDGRDAIAGKSMKHLRGVDEAIADSRLIKAMRGHMDVGGYGDIAVSGFNARGDAATSIVLARDLQYVSAVAAMQPLSALTSFDAFPMNVDQPKPFQTKYTYRNFSGTGVQRISRNYDDLGQSVKVSATSTDTPIVASIANAQWNMADIVRASLGEYPLQAFQLMYAMRQINQDVNNLNWFGDSAQGVTGIYDNAGITKTSVTAWSGLAPDQILAQFRALITRIVTAIKGVQDPDLRPNAIRVSPSCMMELAQPMSNVGGNPMGSWTIKQAIEQQLMAAGGGAIEFESSPELEDNGSAARWAICYRKDSAIGGRLLPVAPSFLPPDVESMLISQPVHAQSGGVSYRYPVSAQIIYGM